MEPSPALALHFSAGMSAPARDRLVALLSDHSLIAIHEDDLVSPRVWTAHFPDVERRDSARADVLRQPEAAFLTVESVDVPDDDWARRTQADLPPVTVDRVTITPPWAATSVLDVEGSDRIVVVIEPSRGFGTGHHQSTRLCLRLMQRVDLRGATVVDIGTGSGVLAIAAAKLGASSVEGIDEDPEAVENARENVERNGVVQRVSVRVGDALSGVASMTGADIVTANLTGTLLSRHADSVGAFVREGGLLIVSGLTIDERKAVLDAFRPGFEVNDSAEEDGWWAFVFKARPHHS